LRFIDKYLIAYKLIVFFILSIFSSHHTQAFEISGKTIRCDANKFPTRGYPFYFYFADKNKFLSYYILDKKIKYHNFDYKQINENIYELSNIGFFNKKDLILTHSKYNTKCLCNLLDTKKQISVKLKSFIGK
tara:strand:+ start:530 stop:925 length:396 start_codon:yes stop_codon:yes gene_type:complete